MARRTVHDFTIAAVARETKVRAELADVPLPELLREMAAIISHRAKLRVEFLTPDANGFPFARGLAEIERAVAGLPEIPSPPALAAMVKAGLKPPRLGVPHSEKVAAVETTAVDVLDRYDEIRGIAALLAERIAAFRTDFPAPSRPSRADALRREFLSDAAAAWQFLTGKKPRASKKGPFVRFCVALWNEAGFSDLSDDPEEKLGVSIERQFKTAAAD